MRREILLIASLLSLLSFTIPAQQDAEQIHKELAVTLIEAFWDDEVSEAEFDTIVDDLYATSFVYHAPVTGATNLAATPDLPKSSRRLVHARLTHIWIHIDNLVAQGGLVVVHYTVRATPSQSFMFSPPFYLPAERESTWEVVTILRFDNVKRIVEAWDFWNNPDIARG